ncbi:MAG: CvpA family protein [Chloroflexi bacterium]|nr:CvpA family protein [Chloroflexota bacterium]
MPNWVDVAILVVVAWNIANAVRRGFVTAAVSLVAFLLSVSLAIVAYVRVADWAAAQFGVPSLIAQPVAFAAVWFVTNFLLETVGRFLAAPFGWLLHGSPLDLLVSIVPGAIKGFAVSGFALMVLLAPPPLPIGVPGEAFAAAREAVQESQLAGELLTRTAGYDRWARGVLEEPVSQTLSLLTVRPNAGERVDLNFQIEAPQIDELAEAQLFELLNHERTKAGLAPVTRDTGMDAVARAHSIDMLRRGYFAHEAPEGTSPFERMLRAGIRFRLAGENLALAPTVELAHQGLMDSPGHRANMLSTDFGRVGIGALKVDGMGKIFTQDFAN